MTADITVPEGCTATVELPGCAPLALGPGDHVLDTAELGAAA
jgi:alpha-L-rhamnosidase